MEEKHQNELCFYPLLLTNFSGHGKSNSFTIPKSSPVTMLRPEWETQAQVTSALSVLRDQIPTTSSPRTLDTYSRVRSAGQILKHTAVSGPHLVQLVQVILSMWVCSVTCFPDGTSYTRRL